MDASLATSRAEVAAVPEWWRLPPLDRAPVLHASENPRLLKCPGLVMLWQFEEAESSLASSKE